MAANKESVGHTVRVALILCVVCSVIVAGSAVILKPTQEINRTLDRNKNILAAAGLYREGEHERADIERLFSQFEVRAVDLETGRFATDEELAGAGINLETYEQRAAARNPDLSRSLERAEDMAGIRRRARYAVVYLLREQDRIERIVLPVHGYGLWGTLYGYLAVEGDGQTVAGLGFYEHKETPGLGAEVDNPNWKAQWPGKKIFDGSGAVALNSVKNRDAAGPRANYEVDSLSGATLTSIGVDNMMQFWLGDNGFGPFLSRIKGEV